MSLNARLFLKINGLIGKNKWLDAFGRVGAEFVVIIMMGWYVAGDFIDHWPGKRLTFWPLAFLAAAWALAWMANLLVGMIVKEPRPHVTLGNSKLLFTPLMSWKSFPSDHAMSAFLIFFLALIFQLPLAWVLLPLAVWVAWGRVYSGVHYPLDVVGGAAVAGLVALLVRYLYLLML